MYPRTSVQKEASQKMEIKSTESAYLSTSNGKYVCMQRAKRTLQLVSENRQGQGPEVKVYHISYNGRPCMAFCFEVDNKSVFPVVTEKEEVESRVLSLDKPITPGILDKSFLFKWGERDCCGAWRSLNSVAEPSKFLSVEEHGKVIIKTHPDPGFKILDKERDTANKELQRNARTDKIQKSMTTQYRKNTLQKRPSCCERSVAPTKRLYCPQRGVKRMKNQ
ncbi:uncharacterized protein [Garra rufa]|uniref:uncharacterized protein n=1 Tax=Garra rufa TaxID=137080 RepID=UPI003CCEDC90